MALLEEIEISLFFIYNRVKRVTNEGGKSLDTWNSRSAKLFRPSCTNVARLHATLRQMRRTASAAEVRPSHQQCHQPSSWYD